MSIEKGTSAEAAYLFIFDGRAEGVSGPALSMFTERLLEALSAADPEGTVVAELKGGVPLLSEFARQIGAVSTAPNRSGYRQTHDMALYRLLLWDMAEALSEGAGAPKSRAILDVLRLGKEECLALSGLPLEVRDKCDLALRRCPGYVGSCLLDPGNPVQRRAFYDGLLRLGLIRDGCVILEKSIEGDEDFELRGARAFKPNGLRWVPFADDIMGAAEFTLNQAPTSERGALSVDRLRRKTRTTVEGRVFRALIDASWRDQGNQAYSFEAAGAGSDILEAVLPDGKFTDYLFNRDHPEGGAKATYIIDELGFSPEDWRFLAAQLYDALLLSEPRNLTIQTWVGGYGARFNTLVAVTSRSGKSGVLRTGWVLQPGKLPSLATAVPDRRGEGIVEPPAPPVLLPKTDRDEDWWAELFELANIHGKRAARTVLPTPMLLESFEVIEEGEAGGAVVHVRDARRGFARWLLESGKGNHDDRGGANIFAQIDSQSIERAEGYARAFARVLALNGIPCDIEAYYS